MQVHLLRREAEERAAPVRDVVDGQFSDHPDVADQVGDFGGQLVERRVATEVRAQVVQARHHVAVADVGALGTVVHQEVLVVLADARATHADPNVRRSSCGLGSHRYHMPSREA